MTSNAQELIAFPEAYVADQKVDELRELLRQVFDRYGRKEVAHELDMNRSSIDNMILGRDRHPLKAKVLLFAVLIDERRLIVDWLCRLAEGVYTPNDKLSDNQKLARAMRAMRRYVSADVAQEIELEASGGVR